MTFFASLALVLVLVIRPQEIWPELGSLYLLDSLTALTVIGLLVELATGKQKNLYSPQLPFVGAFLLWGYFVTSLALGSGRGIPLATARALIPAVFMAAVMFGGSTLPKLRSMIWLLVLLGAFTSAVAVHQGSMTPECIERTVDDEGNVEIDPRKADGRECGMAMDCRDETRPDAEWDCERVGLFGTYSTGRRVRWRGQLGDPNELSVFIGGFLALLFGLGLPFRNAAAEDRLPGTQRALATFAFVVIGIGLWAVVLSQSRGGQLVIATVFGLFFLLRFGVKGLLLAGVFALPVILFGGRSAEEADVSANERVELLYEGVSLFIAHPIRGVGIDQFPDQVASPLHLTAHNSYLLAAAETGFPGMFLWTGILWTSLKIPFIAMRRQSLPEDLRVTARSIIISFTGIAVGIFFLSFTFKQLLFVWFGLSGSLHRILRERDPTFDVAIGWRDLAAMLAIDSGLLAALYLYTRMRAAG